ncbi:cystatin-C-like [Pleuronectes platessa]|uniref:cystatin-C-like n=1 Tax=Pleuronectes platessa TaxID=8262 RepID=UPI00232A7190|nr:cystatin-C-like [Pleuronectes platessa]
MDVRLVFASSGRVLPAQPHALPVNGSQVLAAAQFAVFEFNTVNAEQQFEVLNVTSANIHLVAGLDYILEVQLGSTTCTKSHRPTLGEPRDLSSFKCKFVVTEILCKNSHELTKKCCLHDA